jgi:hypothetical protein
MATIWFERTAAGDEEAIVRWRFDELVRAGYGWGSALKVAKRLDVDLHLATRLLETGCPTETALRILL